MKKMFLLGAVAACGLGAFAVAPFDVVALVDSLDFAHVYDIETATGTVQTLEHVLPNEQSNDRDRSWKGDRERGKRHPYLPRHPLCGDRAL